MKYKLYEYELTDNKNKLVSPDRHFEIFKSSIGIDATGRFARYRGRDDAVLMNVRRSTKSSSDFMGLIGRHSTEREVTVYDTTQDEADNVVISDDDYPNSPFICMPRLRMIACVDSSKLSADSAISRLHAILIARQGAHFVAQSVKAAYDLRLAIRNFRVFEVDFEIFPVNPHSGDLGLELDESRKRDHVRTILGKMKSNKHDGLELNGGILTAVQQLQKSGHAAVGYKAETKDGIQINVQKPRQSAIEKLSEEETDSVDKDVRIDFVGMPYQFPLSPEHVTDMRTVARKFLPEEGDE